MQCVLSSAQGARLQPHGALSRHRACAMAAPSRRQRRVQRREGPWPSVAAAAAAAGGEPAAEPSVGAGAAATAEAPALPGRKFVYAVDGKPDCEQALRWAVHNIFSKGGSRCAALLFVVCHRRRAGGLVWAGTQSLVPPTRDSSCR